jgi:hypothetical protein
MRFRLVRSLLKLIGEQGHCVFDSLRASEKLSTTPGKEIA